ncbi:MAG: DUF2817 domain-containing protein [Magnetococcales bacterium]|nr:DUF2817 domain-containing protein [Magnetococcales bacterium]
MQIPYLFSDSSPLCSGSNSSFPSRRLYAFFFLLVSVIAGGAQPAEATETDKKPIEVKRLTTHAIAPDDSSQADFLAPLSVQEALQEIVEQAADRSILAPKPKKRNTQNDEQAEISPHGDEIQSVIDDICGKIGAKLGSVSKQECLDQRFILSGGHSINKLPIIVREYPPLENRKPQARILLISGIHGDEYSAVSVTFKWMKILDRYHTGLFHWRVAPLVNPDGLLRKNSQRMNARNVDLNRNFPTTNSHREWLAESQSYWVNQTHRDPRRYPGPAPLSEPESNWVAEEIERFKPDAVVSVHAPFGLLDFDGPPTTPPERLGQLYLSLLGTYPGSLGRYAGTIQKIPIITIELEHAGIMPQNQEISTIWRDLVSWLKGHVRSREPITETAEESRTNTPQIIGEADHPVATLLRKQNHESLSR